VVQFLLEHQLQGDKYYQLAMVIAGSKGLAYLKNNFWES
jgi:hypothetical protein